MTRARDLAAGTFELATGGVLKLETSDTTVTDGSVLGKIEFKAPDEASGTDAILVGAAIEAVAEGTFAADNNATELVFKTGASAAADAKMTLTSGGNLGIGTSSPSTTLDLVGSWVSNTGQLSIDTPSGETYSGLAILNNGAVKGFLYHDNSAGALDLQTYTTDALRFKTNNTERMRIDATGNVLHTVASQGSAFVPNTPSTWNALEIFQDRGVTNSASGIAFRSQSGTAPAGIVSVAGNTTGGIESLAFMTSTGNATAERVRIDSSGKVLVNRTGADGSAFLQVACSGAGGYGIGVASGSGATVYVLEFRNSNGVVGTITTAGSATAYNTSSDYRLKTDAQPMTGASARVQALNPVNFEWIADGTRVDGFLAHEAQEVVPEAVTGTKDAMRDEEYEVTPAVLDDDGNETTAAVMGTRSVPDLQGIEQSKMVPLLVAALQEALARITALENA